MDASRQVLHSQPGMRCTHDIDIKISCSRASIKAKRARREIAELQRTSGRRVGPAAADKLYTFCMCDEPGAMYAEKE